MTTCQLVSLISSQDLVFTKNMKNLNASPGNFRKVPTIQGSDKVILYKSHGVVKVIRNVLVVFQIDHKINENFVSISAIASKKRLNKKKVKILYSFFNYLKIT